MSPVLDMAVLGDEAALEALEPEWWDLWSRCPEATPFQSPAWLLAWWRAFRPGEPSVWTVRDGGRLIALAALYLEQGDRRRLLPMGIAASDYIDVLLHPGSRALALAGLERLAARTAPGWDELELCDLAPDAAARALRCPPGGVANLEPTVTCPVLAFGEGPCSLEVAVPARKRRKLRMARHRAEKLGCEMAGAAEYTAADWVAHLCRLHAARWRQRGEAGVLADGRAAGFHAESLPRLLARGLARLSALRAGGRVVGVYYGVHRGRRAYAYLGGFDPEFAYCSPGTLLLAHAIEQALAEGAREFHFLRGAEPYKYEWGAGDRWSSRLVFRACAP